MGVSDTFKSSVILQVLVGCVITYCIYIASLFAIRADQLVMSNMIVDTKRQKILIINGVLNSSEIAQGSSSNAWNTTIPFIPNYLPITPSVNIKGGAQFSYSFWLYVGDPVNAKGKTLLLKGDKKSYNYIVKKKIYNPNSATTDSEFGIPETKSDRVVMCPMFSFGEEELEFTVTFNTLHNINESMVVKRVQTENSLKRNNLQGLLAKTWFRVTFIFEDNVVINDFEKGIRVRFYLNDSMYQTQTYASTLRQNRGDLFIFPDETPIKDCKIADLAYFNYALSDDEVSKLSTTMPNSLQSASTTYKNSNAPFDTVSQNVMDVYNIGILNSTK